MMKCKRCLFPDTVPKISYDDEGICSYCHKHKKIAYAGEPRFTDILDGFRNTKNKYDCMVTISGGRDSSYTLLKTVNDYGMKVLAVNFENPFTNPQAVSNMEKATTLLGVDFVRIKTDRKKFESCLRNNLKAWVRRPSLSMLPMLCIYCRTMEFEFWQLAKRLNIRCLVSGANPMQDTSFISELISVDSSASFHKAITRSLPHVMKEVLANPRYLKPEFIPITVKSYISAIISAFGPKKFGFDLTTLAFFYFVEWNEHEVESRIKEELGWQHPKNTTQRFDCPVAHLKDFIYWKSIGITKIDDYYAKMIRDGLISREAASQKIIAQHDFDIDALKDFVGRLGVSEFNLYN